MTNQPLSIAILETGLPPADLAEKFARYPQMVETWLKPYMPEASFVSFSPVTGEELSSPKGFDGLVITGSRHSVLDDADWMQTLKSLILEAGKCLIPVFGICFGHQIMASAYGGEVVRSKNGWGVGVQQYHQQFEGGLKTENAFLFHQDQVLKAPENAALAGGNYHCPIGVLDYGALGMSVQYHPEFTADYVAALIDIHGGSTFSAELGVRAYNSLKGHSLLGEKAGMLAAALFRQHAKKP